MESQGTPYPPSSAAQPEPQKGSDVPPPYSPPPVGAYPPPGSAYPPTAGGYPPPMVYPSQPGMAYPPQQPGVGITYQTVPAPNDAIIRSTQQTTIVVGAGNTCPRCHTGVLQDDITLLGICCAIFFFPIGIICCLMMRQRRCSHCGSVYM